MADPVQLLALSLSQPPNSPQQLSHLTLLRQALDAQPSRLTGLISNSIRSISDARGTGKEMFRDWMLDIVNYSLSGKAVLTNESKASIATSSLDTLQHILMDPYTDPPTLKAVINCYSSAYPVLFRSLCQSRQPSARAQWDTLTRAKNKILGLISSKDKNKDNEAPLGVRLAAIKFAQRALLVQTRGNSDPRLQNRADTSLALIPSDHPFLSAQALEQEAMELFKTLLPILFESSSTDLISALLSSFSPLITHRPSYHPFLLKAFAQWTPKALIDAGEGFSSLKSVEKSLRGVVTFIGRHPQAQSSILQAQIGELLSAQSARMEQERQNNTQINQTKKRALPEPVTEPEVEAKRPKLEPQPQPQPQPVSISAKELLSQFDLRTLPPQLVTELIVASLGAVDEARLGSVVQARRLEKAKEREAAGLEKGKGKEKMEVVEEGNVDVGAFEVEDEQELEFEPEEVERRIKPSTSGTQRRLHDQDQDQDTLLPATLSLPPPVRLSTPDRARVVSSTFSRFLSEAAQGEGQEMLRRLLVVRVVTRGMGTEEEGDDATKLRERICAFVCADLGGRTTLAHTWLNEEWYNDRLLSISSSSTHTPQYPLYLSKIIQSGSKAGGKVLQTFLMDLPEITPEVLESVKEMCLSADRMQVGFPTLREIVSGRVTMRDEAMGILLDLCTHPDRLTRTAAINTVKRWIPDVQPMDQMTRRFSIRLLRRLQKRPAVSAMDTDEDGELPREVDVETEWLTAGTDLEELDEAERKEGVRQHVELVLALCVKAPEMLEELFSSYVTMSEGIQTALQEIATPLIRSLGSTNAHLLNVLRSFPPGAESLLLKVLTIFTASRPNAAFVTLMKGLIAERELGSEFIIPIIGEMDKSDIVRHLPRIVSVLNEKEKEKMVEHRKVVRGVFESIVHTGSVSMSSNLPRVRGGDGGGVLMPVELMVLLHHSEKEIGLKGTIEAIGICFSMTEIFKSEILAAVMQQIVEDPVLPTLFMRTVIQTVTAYKSLIPFVSTTLLSRLITKKVWTDSNLWQGFIMCAKKIAPASYGALLQLPKEQLRELVEKQSDLKTGLREYVIKKAGSGGGGGNVRGKLAGFLEIFGEAPAPGPDAMVVSATPTPVATTPMREESPVPQQAPLPQAALSPPTAA